MVRKGDIRQVDAVARQLNMTREQRQEFGRFLEAEKRSASPRDFTYQELVELGRIFLDG